MTLSVRTKSILLALLKLAVTFAIFYLIARKINFTDVLNAPVQDRRFLGLALFLAMIVVPVQGLRWHLLCIFLGVGSDITKNIKAVWAGHLLNNVLPTSAVGDVLRSYALKNRGAGRSQWVSALLVEKYFSVITALLLSVAVVLTAQMPTGVPDIIRIIVVSTCLAGAGVTIAMRIVNRIGAGFFPEKLTRFLETLSSIVSQSVRNKTGLMTLLTSLVVNIMICMIYLCIAEAMGLKIDLMDCLFIVPVFTILAGLPISYGGWGVREMTSIQLLQYYGVGPEIALSSTILFGLTVLLSSLPGLLFLPAFRKTLISKE